MIGHNIAEFEDLKRAVYKLVVFPQGQNCTLLRHLNPSTIITPFLPKIHFNIILPSTLKHGYPVSLLCFFVNIEMCAAVSVTLKEDITPRFKKTKFTNVTEIKILKQNA